MSVDGIIVEFTIDFLLLSTITFMKNVILLNFLSILFIWIPIASYPQTGGINFENGTSWQALLKLAKAENKYIFVDCYATWCGPCRFMAEHIFPQKEVGEYFNAHFINVRYQMDSIMDP